MVPEPSRSPTLIAQPLEAWCTSCCTDDQYMYLKLVALIVAGAFIAGVRRPTSSAMS